MSQSQHLFVSVFTSFYHNEVYNSKARVHSEILIKKHRKCVQRFIKEAPESQILTKLCVSKLVKKWQTTGLVCNKNRASKRNMLTKKKFETFGHD